MNNAQLHLVINHLPITFVAIGILIMVCGYFCKSDLIKRIAYSVFFIAAAFGFVALNTGEEAKLIVQGVSGINSHLIAVHEQKAIEFLVYLYILGVLSLFGFLLNWRKIYFSKIIGIITVIFAFVVLYFAFQTGITGGEIRHPEILSKLLN